MKIVSSTLIVLLATALIAVVVHGASRPPPKESRFGVRRHLKAAAYAVTNGRIGEPAPPRLPANLATGRDASDLPALPGLVEGGLAACPDAPNALATVKHVVYDAPSHRFLVTFVMGNQGIQLDHISSVGRIQVYLKRGPGADAPSAAVSDINNVQENLAIKSSSLNGGEMNFDLEAHQDATLALSLSHSGLLIPSQSYRVKLQIKANLNTLLFCAVTDMVLVP